MTTTEIQQLLVQILQISAIVAVSFALLVAFFKAR